MLSCNGMDLNRFIRHGIRYLSHQEEKLLREEEDRVFEKGNMSEDARDIEFLFRARFTQVFMET